MDWKDPRRALPAAPQENRPDSEVIRELRQAIHDLSREMGFRSPQSVNHYGPRRLHQGSNRRRLHSLTRQEIPMNTPETQRPTRPRFCSDEAIQEMYNIIEDFALYAKDRDSTTVHITVKEAIAVVESALARRRFQLAVRAEPRGRSPYEQQPRQEP